MCTGCAPPEIKAFFFVFTFKICSPHQSVMPLLGGAPSPEKILGPPPPCSVDHLSIVASTDIRRHMRDGTIGRDRRLMQ